MDRCIHICCVNDKGFDFSLNLSLEFHVSFVFPLQTETVNVISNEHDRHPDELYAIIRDFLHQIYFR